jgi:hypothetical protein
MGKVKAAWTIEQENEFQDPGFEDLINEIRAFSRELQEDNNRAEERENERARQRVSIR